MKYLKNEEEARDRAMEVFGGLGNKLIKFEVAHFNSWLLTLTKNECLMQLRKKKREFSVENNEIIRLTAVENKDEVHLRESGSIEELILSSLEKLRECQRQCLDLMYLQNKSYKEISLITGYSLQEVKSYIQNGKRNLKNLMARDYGKEG
jgi:RNA polymerase sigma-70 factor (ECF subfamily)